MKQSTGEPDALTAAPQHHKLLFENEFVRVLDSRTLEKPFANGTAAWSNPLPAHTLKNIGENDLHVISVEIKK